jgi:uncharacterized protein
LRTLLLHTIAMAGLNLPAGCSAPGSGAEQPLGPVIDRAEIIPPAVEQRLDRELRDYYNRTGRALVVATTPSLGSESIDRYSLAMANRLGIGDRKTNQGLLLLVAPNERKVRIEVGRGLEQTITNAIAASIIQESLLPSFSKGDLVGGIDEGVDALIATTECRVANGVSAYCPERAKQ